MKQFSLEEYLKNPNRKVVTRNNRTVRIICTDRKSKGMGFCIVGLVSYDEGAEQTVNFLKDGRHSDVGESRYDLFFAPEKHEGWINVYKNEERVLVGTIYPFKSEDDAKKASEDEGYIATCKIIWEE